MPALHILFMNKPLEGGLDAPGESDEMTPDMINKFMALFRAHSEFEDVLSGLDRFTRSIGDICASGKAPAVRPSLRDCVKNAVCRTASVIVDSFNRSTSPRSSAMRRNEGFELRVQQTLESHVLRRLHEPIFKICRDTVAEEDRKLSNAIEMHRRTDKRTFGIEAEFDCSTAAAEAKFRSIRSCRTPLEQAQCIAETSRLIKSAVETHYRGVMDARPKARYKEFATDDLLCIIIYVLSRCGNAHRLSACFNYIEEYHFASITTTAIGFHVAHFQVAAEWLIEDMERKARAAATKGPSEDAPEGAVGLP